MNAPLTVYIVDDEEPIRHSLETLFGALSIPAKTFSTAAAFLEGYVEGCPGCAFVDLRMPGMSGLELLAELRRRNPSLPVVLMTGHGDATLRRQAQEAGAVATLEKPFSLERLMEILDRLLAKA